MKEFLSGMCVATAMIALSFHAGQLCPPATQPVTASSAPQQMASNDVSEFVRMIRDTTERIQPLPVRGVVK